MTQFPASRSLQVTWEDPELSAAEARRRSGLEFLQALRDGVVAPSPIAQVLGMTLDTIEPGFAVFSFQPDERHYNPIGTVHGGVTATILDSALGCAVQSTLPAGTLWTTIELSTHFLKGVSRTTGRLAAEGRVIHVGGRIGTAEARLVDAAGVLYAHATTMCLIMRGDRPGT